MISMKSISTRTLSQMAFRIAVVVCTVTAVSYWHLIGSLETRTKENVGRYIAERGERERLAFDEAQLHHNMMGEEFVRLYKSYLKNPKTPQLFDKVAKVNSAGVVRNRSPRFDGTKEVGIFAAPPSRKFTLDLKAKMLAAYEVTERFGLAYHHEYQDTYFTFPENAILLYWPEMPNWVRDASDKYDILSQEYYQIALEKNNPDRKTKWSALFYDEVSKFWMVTASTPVYIDNKFVGAIHHDLMVNEIFERTVEDRLSNTDTYYIVRDDGRLILHPAHFEQIKKQGGNFDLMKSGDKLLIAQFQALKEIQENGVIESPDGKSYLAVAKLASPGWYLVTSYPKTIIRDYAANTAAFVLIGGLVSLLIEICILYMVLKKQISFPLLQLIQATNKVARGGGYTKINLDRKDELGELATSFNEMTRNIQERDQNLEMQVEQRTKELDEQKTINMQASKMVSLGEMAGAIAHEINTPLATIKLLTSQLNHEIQEDLPDLENIGTQLVKIEATTDRVAKIIKGLKTFSRDGSADNFEEVRASTIVEDTVALCAEKMKQHEVELRIDTSAQEVIFACRGVQISQVLLNLINNAHDAVENLNQKWIEIKVIGSDEFVEFRVTDSGRGIDKKTQEKIFQPFFTTKGIGKGTGMGLSISLGIVKAHHGQIFVDESSSNTCFVVRLPLRQSMAA